MICEQLLLFAPGGAIILFVTTPIRDIIKSVFSAWFLFGTMDTPDDLVGAIGDLEFIPGVGWEFDDGVVKGLQEFNYNVLPGALDPDGGE